MITVRCPYCKGTGKNIAEYGAVVCGDCDGRGRLAVCQQCACLVSFRAMDGNGRYCESCLEMESLNDESE